MLKIQRTASGEVIFAVSGQLEADTLGELSGLLAREAPGLTVALELRDLILVDRDAVDFLRACKGRGIILRNCPPYIRMWMADQENQE